MASKRSKTSFEYYAVVKGRVDQPTIFSSWGDVHPRVTGLSSVHKAFCTIEKAREYMKTVGVVEAKEVIKEGAGSTTPTWGSEAFFAVANGQKPGIYKHWYGKGGTQPEVVEAPNACYKRFRTRDQAEAFIEDWKQTTADLYRAAIKEALDRGWRPPDLKFSIAGLLQEAKPVAGDVKVVDELRIHALQLDNKQGKQ